MTDATTPSADGTTHRGPSSEAAPAAGGAASPANTRKRSSRTRSPRKAAVGPRRPSKAAGASASALREPRRAKTLDASHLFDLAGLGILMQGEDPAYWRAIHDGIRAAVEPADTLEAFWVSNMASLAHEVIRYRAMRDGLLNGRRYEGLRRLLSGRLPSEPVDKLTLHYRIHGPDDPGTRERLDELGIDEDAITAATFHVCLDDTERYDRLILLAEARLHVAQREMDGRRLARRRLDAALPGLIEEGVQARIRAGGAGESAPPEEPGREKAQARV